MSEKTEWGTYLDWFTKKGRDFQWNNDAGVRFSSTLDPFVRMRFQKYWRSQTQIQTQNQAQSQTRIKFDASVFWFRLRGFGHRWYFEVRRFFSQKHLLRFHNEALWLDKNGFFNLSHGLIWVHELRSQRVLSYGGLVEAESHSLRAENYRAYVNYRRPFYKKWMYIQIQPEVYYPRDRRFEFVPGIQFRLETFFPDS